MSERFDRNLLGVADVDDFPDRVRRIDEASESFDSVADIAKTARLLAIAVDADGFAVQGGFDKVGQHHAITAGLTRADGIEKADDDDGQLLFLPIRQSQKFVECFRSGITPTALGGGAEDEVSVFVEGHIGVFSVDL